MPAARQRKHRHLGPRPPEPKAAEMRLTAEQRRLVHAVQTSGSRGFIELARLAELNLATDFIGANLRGIDFGPDDLTGANFSRADLRDANLLRARGLQAVVWDDAVIDETTRGWPMSPPAGFDLDEVRRMIVAGRTPPAEWWPFITKLDLSSTAIPGLYSIGVRTTRRYFTQKGLNIDDLGALRPLTALRSLDLRGTQVRDVSPLGALTALRTLDLMRTQVRDVSPLGALTALQRLDLSATQVSDVSPLGALTALQNLYLIGTAVHDVSSLGKLVRVNDLGIKNPPGFVRRALRRPLPRRRCTRPPRQIVRAVLPVSMKQARQQRQRPARLRNPAAAGPRAPAPDRPAYSPRTSRAP